MSILIKGMEMPTSCFDCDCAEIYGDGYFHCNRIGETFEEDDFRMARHPDCPMIELPPHGRLIDADALEVQDGWLRDSKYFAQESSHTHITFVYSNDIVNAPTVIPSDKDGET